VDILRIVYYKTAVFFAFMVIVIDLLINHCGTGFDCLCFL